MIFYSHWVDMLTKLVSLAILMFLLIISRLIDVIKVPLASTPNPEFFLLLSMGAIMSAYYFLFHRPIVEVIGTSLYVRQRFGVRISWDQARLLRRLFSLDRRLQWRPMTHVRSLPPEQRLQALLEEASQ